MIYLLLSSFERNNQFQYFLIVVDFRSDYIFRLEFRRLVRMYGVDLCFTPMIMTDSFCQSEKARRVEFSTSIGLNRLAYILHFI